VGGLVPRWGTGRDAGEKNIHPRQILKRVFLRRNADCWKEEEDRKGILGGNQGFKGGGTAKRDTTKGRGEAFHNEKKSG